MDEGVNSIATHEPPLPGSGFGRTGFLGRWIRYQRPPPVCEI